MERKAILSIAVIFLTVTGLTQAQEGELHGVVDVTYQSKYVWRGFNIFGSKSAFQPSLDLDLYGTGFGLNVVSHVPLSGGHVNDQRWDYTLYYSNQVFEDETYVTDYRLGWMYYNFPDQPTKGSMTAPNAALEEVHAILSWPKICPAGWVPSYAVAKLWPHRSGSYSASRSPSGGTASAWVHIFMLDYALTVPGLLPETPEQPLNFHAELVYNDGFGPAGQNVDHDWSHVLFGASTDFDLGNNMFLTPGLYYQITMEDGSINAVNSDKDQGWVTLGMSYRF